METRAGGCSASCTTEAPHRSRLQRAPPSLNLPHLQHHHHQHYTVYHTTITRRMAQLAISVNSPEIVYPTLLSLDERQITTACKELLQFLDLPAQEPFRVKYRLELLPNQNDWSLRLKVDSVAWFDFLERSLGLEKATEIARRFYTNSFNFLRNQPPASNPSGTVPINPSYGCTTPSCQFHRGLQQCRNGPIVPTCGQQVVRTNGIAMCTFSYLSSDLVVVPFGPLTHLVNPIYKSTGYYLRARPEDSRDLVICPVQHTTNTVLACSEPFWKCVILTLAGFVTLAQPPQPSPGTICEGIALNFGIWETENAREVSKGVVQFAVDCHGHAHILLSPNGFAELERIPDFKCLRGRFRHPDSHLRNDCSDLQTERLLAAENSLLRSDVGALSDRMTGLEGRMTGLEGSMTGLEGRMTGLEGRMTGLEGRMTGLEGGMKDIKSLLEKLLQQRS